MNYKVLRSVNAYDAAATVVGIIGLWLLGRFLNRLYGYPLQPDRAANYFVGGFSLVLTALLIVTHKQKGNDRDFRILGLLYCILLAFQVGIVYNRFTLGLIDLAILGTLWSIGHCTRKYHELEAIESSLVHPAYVAAAVLMFFFCCWQMN